MEKAFEMFSLKGKVAVVTGGAGVLGGAMARGLAAAGASIAICDIANAQEAASRLSADGFDAAGFACSVLDRGSFEEAARQVLGKWGRVDILLNTAGGNMKEATTSAETAFFDLPLPAVEKTVALNLYGGAMIPSMVLGREMVRNQSGGSIINVSSMNAFRPLTRIPAYSAAKAAVSNFTQWLAVHLAQEYNPAVRVNAIAPGFFLTTQNRYLLLDEQGQPTPRGKAIIDHTPMGRFGSPDDLVGIAVWLASDASRFVTGTVIPVDGGFSAYAGV